MQICTIISLHNDGKDLFVLYERQIEPYRKYYWAYNSDFNDLKSMCWNISVRMIGFKEGSE